MRITNALERMDGLYPGGQFSMDAWLVYMADLLPGIAEEAVADMRQVISAGEYTWEKDFLPVIQAAWEQTAARAEAVASFHAVTDGLEARIARAGLRPIDVDVTLYLGLCSGAGWVTQVAGRDAVLLGVEKIIELGWGNLPTMTGLILHELGHVYQARYGMLERPELTGRQAFVWQLFTEGIAMVFEQRVMGDEDYFHQDRDGWRAYLQANEARLARDFAADLDGMTFDNQRYFGDWVRWEGAPDAGYYLGARLVRFICRGERLDDILSATPEQAEQWFGAYLSQQQAP